jgi:hypothetical protein
MDEYEVLPSYGMNEDGDLDLHSATGFCPFGCPCHEDPELIGGVNDLYQDGLVTGDEATNITQGKTI